VKEGTKEGKSSKEKKKRTGEKEKARTSTAQKE